MTKRRSSSRAKGQSPRSSVSSASEASARLKLRVRIGAVEDEVVLLRILHEAFVQEVRDMMQGTATLIAEEE